MRKEKSFIYVSWQGECNIQTYQTEEDIKKSKENPDSEKFYSLKKKITPDGERLVFYNEKHALAYGSKMKEYLGMIDIDPANSEEKKVYSMTATEIRNLNLPKIQPNKDITKVVFKGGNSYLWKDYFKNN